jgi:hypothetical protein
MSRRLIALLVAASALVAGAIGLVVMTRSGDPPLKGDDHPVAISDPSVPDPIVRAPRGSASAPTLPAEHVAQAGNDDVIESAPGIETLASEFAQRHWADALAQCADPAVATAGAKACVVSACELHNAMKAYEWLPNVNAADRAEVLSACTEAHVNLTVTRPVHGPIHGLSPHRHFVRSPAGSGG